MKKEGKKMNKKKIFVFTSALFCVLLCIATGIVLYAASPYHPQNITDEAVIQKGTEYTLSVTGISDYNELGFTAVTDGFNFKSKKKLFVYKDEKGIARTTDDGQGECCFLGKYSSPFIAYENYSFCGESYKSINELEKFFEEPDPIYNFDVNNLGIYIQDVIQFKRHFYGNATVKIYRGRLVITELYINGERVLEYKR